MKSIAAVLLLLFSTFAVCAQNNNPNYDADLAETLGADEYGMKMYVMVILKTGTATFDDEEKLNSLYAGHQENIARLIETRELVVVGPFGKNNDHFRGIFIFDVPTVEEAWPLLEGDPAVQEGLFIAEFYPWYGSAALGGYLDQADKIWKVKP